MNTLDQLSLEAELKKKRICRFCLSQDTLKISNIYTRDTRIKSSAPLPIQIMAIASIEVFSNDGMPSYVCSDCVEMFEFSYQFKQMCKKADNLLRQFPLTGRWPSCLDKPIFPANQSPQPIVIRPNKYSKPTQHSTQSSTQQESLLLPKKILNSSVATKMGSVTPDILPKSENDTEVITKAEIDEESSTTFLDKIENNDELSLDDVHQLVAAEDIHETEFVNMDSLPIVVVDSGIKNTKPKLLNKSSIRILNKNAEPANEPRLSFPKIKQDVDGKLEVVAEILNIDDKYEEEPDPTNATPIETNVFPCPFCERTFPLLQLRDIHIKNHSRDRKYPCEHCNKSFFSKYDLQRHSFIHNGEKPYKCSACERAFSRSSLLSRHEKTHTDIPKHICVHCERSFLSKEDMERHAERHNINRPFVCKICNKGFAFKQGLERHEVVHSVQQPYSCQYCEKSFSTTTKLSRHLTAHAGSRPYPCKFCKKSYLLSHHLTRHLRSHKNINDPMNTISFMCMRCNTSFESRDDLISHSATHANENNLACPLCKDIFDNMEDLTSHIQDHSEGEAYACEFCDLIFMTSEKLQTHTDTDHSKEMEEYLADDLAQADKQRDDIQKEKDIIDEKLQKTVNEFLNDELSNEDIDEEKYMKKYIKKEEEKKSPKIINQIIIRKPKNDHIEEHPTEDSLLRPLKQRKVDGKVKKDTDEFNKPQHSKESPTLKRKTTNVTGAVKTKSSNQKTIQTVLKFPKSVTVSKTSPIKTPSTPTVLSAKKIKIEDEPSATSSNTLGDGVDEKMKTETKKIKLTLTKAQVAAMAKEGRIKIKDGKIILKK